MCKLHFVFVFLGFHDDNIYMPAHFYSGCTVSLRNPLILPHEGGRGGQDLFAHCMFGSCNYQVTALFCCNLQHSDPPGLSIQLMEYGNEKPELTAVSFDPTFSPYHYNDYLSSIDDTKLDDDVFLRRYCFGV